MTETVVTGAVAQRWYSRPVLFVADVHRALEFYAGKLRFTTAWHEGDGAGTVCQVYRSECEIILSEDLARAGNGRLFVELTPDGIAELRRELTDRMVPSEAAWWGSDVIRVHDPDGNELFFPVPR